MVSEADRIAERIDFPFTLMEFLFHVRKITFPFAAGRPFVEAVGIRIDVDTPGLTVDDAGKHGFHFRIVVCKLDMREYLCRRVTEPHGMDITGQDEGVGLTIHHLVFASRIQCVGKTVFEHPGELRVFQLCLCGGDCFFNGFGCELPFARCRTFTDILHSGGSSS